MRLRPNDACRVHRRARLVKHQRGDAVVEFAAVRLHASGSFNDCGDAHAAAPTQNGQAISQAAAKQSVDQRAHVVDMQARQPHRIASGRRRPGQHDGRSGAVERGTRARWRTAPSARARRRKKGWCTYWSRSRPSSDGSRSPGSPLTRKATIRGIRRNPQARRHARQCEGRPGTDGDAGRVEQSDGRSVSATAGGAGQHGDAGKTATRQYGNTTARNTVVIRPDGGRARTP